MEENRQKIIIDTDIGDDIDDAFALALAVHSPELELVGITTVFRNSEIRAKIAKALLSSYGREDIPVCAGMDIPLLQEFSDRDNDIFDDKGRLIPCQYDCDIMKDFMAEAEWGPDFIIRSILENPGQITLIPIGPLTNVAAAIRKCPEIVSKIKKIVLMGGAFHEDFPEWNILCDPEAARIVFTSGADIYAVGLDVTMKCRLTMEQVRQFEALSSDGSVILSRMMKSWFEHYRFECPVLHDPLTVGCVINPSFVVFRQQEILVDLMEGERGKTRMVSSPEKGSSGIWIAESVEASEYLSFFRERVFT
ncbi:nucleoside hydrolase [Eisenbergiella porci]|uniref:nucleoside hydrolase n=1 Tax=Eisenbergiella porci TaxID=2652274 RepID=UPI002A82CDE5|nr:nucleoside hydrolase [Eisenbergiella porci]